MYRNPSSSFSLSYTSEMGVETLTMLCPFTRRKKAWLEFSCRRRLLEVRKQGRRFTGMAVQTKALGWGGKIKSSTNDSSGMSPPKAALPYRRHLVLTLELREICHLPSALRHIRWQNPYLIGTAQAALPKSVKLK